MLVGVIGGGGVQRRAETVRGREHVVAVSVDGGRAGARGDLEGAARAGETAGLAWTYCHGNGDASPPRLHSSQRSPSRY